MKMMENLVIQRNYFAHSPIQAILSTIRDFPRIFQVEFLPLRPRNAYGMQNKIKYIAWHAISNEPYLAYPNMLRNSRWVYWVQCFHCRFANKRSISYKTKRWNIASKSTGCERFSGTGTRKLWLSMPWTWRCIEVKFLRCLDTISEISKWPSLDWSVR